MYFFFIYIYIYTTVAISAMMRAARRVAHDAQTGGTNTKTYIVVAQHIAYERNQSHEVRKLMKSVVIAHHARGSLAAALQSFKRV